MKSLAKSIILGVFIAAFLALTVIFVTRNAALPEPAEEAAEEPEIDVKSLYPDKVISRGVKTGDTITFGNYPQDKDGTVRPIEWIVLDVKDGQALIISKKGLDCQPYHTNTKRINWGKCSLRKWLNNDFYKAAFTSDEQTKIIETTHLSPMNDFKRQVFRNQETTEKVFLLSGMEVTQYFYDDFYLRTCDASDYIYDKVNAGIVEFNKKYGENLELKESCSWWLRNPGKLTNPFDKNSFSAGFVSDKGIVYFEGGASTDSKTVAVRPAINVDVSSVAVEERISTIPRTGDDYIEITEERFPNERFRQIMTNRYDLDKDGYFSKDEIDQVSEIDLTNLEISDIKGIEFFTSVKDLVLSKNYLSGTVDLSKLVNLVSFSMEYNKNNTQEEFNLVFNLNTGLSSIKCRNSQINGLDVFGCYNLKSIDCSGNRLTGLDVRTCFNLETINSEHNNLTGINLSNNRKLKEFQCAYNQLDGIDLTNNPELEVLALGPNLENYYVSPEKKNSIGNLDLSNCPKLKKLLIDWSGIGILDISNCTQLEQINLNGNTNVYNRMKWTSFDNLKVLNCVKQSITSFDMTRFPSLERLVCAYNQLTELDVSGSRIKRLDCKYNKLTSLKINADMEGLECDNNKLTSLDLTNSPNLSYADCRKNNIKTLCLSAYPDLWKSAKTHNKYRKDRYSVHNGVISGYNSKGEHIRSIYHDNKVVFTFKKK